MKLRPEKLGSILLSQGLVTENELDSALSQQDRCHSKLGKILIGQGVINNYALHRSVAKWNDRPFADLTTEPCDPSLLSKAERYHYITLEVIPWKQVGGVTILATADITESVIEWANATYANSYRFAITSPYDIFWTVQRVFTAEDDTASRQMLWNTTPEYSAKTLLLPRHKHICGFLLYCLGLSLLVAPTVSLSFLFVGINLIYLVTTVFKILLVAVSYARSALIERQAREPYQIAEEALPVYTILIPLFNETETLSRLTASIRKLDYPKSKLDVKLIVEEGDSATIAAIKALQCESYFELITVPYSLPQTKPKACNYALRYAKGSYVTIYDAEDMPSPAQLRKVIEKFASLPENVICIQAKLNYYNRNEKLLTGLFALEYAVWFDYLLPGLEALRAPLPLGGTSNHFRIEKLRKLNAWDPYNVTEDADLGMRLALHGYHATVIDSLTMEEAPISLKAWLAQRSRWIKGYMQTYIVHMRHPAKLWRAYGFMGMVSFQLFIGAPCLLFMISPAMWLSWALIALGVIHVPGLAGEILQVVGKINIITGMIMPVILSFIVIRKHHWWNLSHCAWLFPFYGLLHSVASFKAFWQLIMKPHYWEKTTHGLSRSVNN